MVSPSSKRRAAKVGIEGSGSSTALAYRALGLTRSAYYRSSRESVQSRRIRKELIELSLKHPRYGYRRITALLRRDGFEINPKKVARIRREEGLKTLHITPGSPWENGHIESFHDKFRDECLNRALFGSLLEARVIVESLRMEYNEQRPHSSLRYLTPSEYGRRHNNALQSAYGLPTPRVAIHPTTIHNINQPIPSELQF